MTPKEYWNQDIERQDQKFYTAFCLLGAGCSDYAVGIDLLRQKKLNWAAMALYYSMVHCGRLACFLAVSDFPTGHGQLANLFDSGLCNDRTWMSRNQRFFNTTNQRIQTQGSFSRDDLVEFFLSCSHPPDVQAQFPKWGQILSKAKKLREDSNYEGLLITHEYNHVRVTEAFEKLVRSFSVKSEPVLREAISLMTTFADASQRREHWYAFLNWKEERQGLYYLEDSLLNRVRDRKALIRVTEFLSPLRRSPEQTLHLATEVREHVKVGVFTGKTNLMDDFEGKIQEFDLIAL